MGFRIVFLAMILFPLTLVYSAPRLIQNKDIEQAFRLRIGILEDQDGRWTFEEIRSSELAQEFVPLQEENLNYGFTESAYWVRIQFSNSFNTDKERLLEVDYALLDHVRYFESSGSFGLSDDQWIFKETGDLLPFDRRDVAHRNFVFRITLRPQEEKIIYLRLTTEGSMQFPIRLWDPVSFSEKVNLSQYGFGLYYGIFLSMALYNFFLFLAVRDTNYLYYVAYIVSLAFTQMALNGLAFQFLWPELPWWANRSVPFLIGSSVFLGLHFTRKFLHLKENVPWIDHMMLGLMGCVILVMPLSLLSSYSLSTQIGAILAMIAVSFVVISSLFSIHRGYQAARYFLIAWTGFLVGVTTISLKNFGLLPRTFLTEFGMQIGSAMEVILLSFALADRINQMKAEKEKALQRQLAESKKVATLSGIFKKFVPPQFIKRISQEGIESIALGNVESGYLSILFSDIRSFTRLSEAMTPKETFDFLNDYMARMEASIHAHGGFVDKYIGDAIMALFDLESDQNNAHGAINAAISMQRALQEYNQQSVTTPRPIVAGIGIHSGNVMIGTVGSSGRMDSTAIGGAVNLASRIEGMTKIFGTSILISGVTRSNIKDPSPYALRIIDLVSVSGLSKPVGVYEVFDGDPAGIKEKKIKTQKYFEEAVSLYGLHQFEEVIKLMKENLKVFPEDQAAKVYIERSRMNLANRG